MSPKAKLHLAEVAVALAVGIILWLLLRSGVTPAPEAPGNNIELETPGGQLVQYNPGVFNLGGITTDPASYSVLFPASTALQASCGCGCNPNDALNTSFQNLATFVNQYAQNAVNNTNQALQAMTANIPDYLSQYLNIGSGPSPVLQ